MFRVAALVFLGFTLSIQSAFAQQPKTPISVSSPDERIELTFDLRDGAPYYAVKRDNKPVILPSRLGFRLQTGPDLADGFELDGSRVQRTDETWEQPWGEQTLIRDQHTELYIKLDDAEGGRRALDIIFRVFNDGVGFRYRIPNQPDAEAIEISDELTEFRLTGDHRAWWIPAFKGNRYEYHYTDSPLSQTEKVHTPFTCKTADGLYLSFHEAALTDFASMTLHRKQGTTFEADLVPWSDGVKVRGGAPMVTPWRTIQMADTPGGLIESYLVLNLNEPNQLGDVSWVKPGKYIGIWWEMHIRKSTWHSGPKHGATTENTKRYIDFAAEHGFDGVLVEGWNVGWDGNWIDNAEKFDFLTPYPDFDLEGLAKYARERGVYLIGHHETGGGIHNYERQMEDAYAMYNRLGVRAVKSGYVGHGQELKRIDENGDVHKEWHHGQWMVRHYRDALLTAARHKVMLNVHEPIKGTGIRRTYPNMLTREGARGQEYNAWGGDGGRNPPDHTTILPFTRMLSGPMDFTPGIFDLKFDEYMPNDYVSTTLAKQLALYVVIYSPLNMAADLPENYAAKPDAFQFIKDVPVDWEFTRVLDAAIGDYVAIARKDRHSDDWYLGAITDENPRSINVKLDFLSSGKSYTAQIYRDADDAHWDTNPHAYTIEQRDVTSNSTLPIKLAPGGGVAIRFVAQ